jgi:hypothetical protein
MSIWCQQHEREFKSQAALEPWNASTRRSLESGRATISIELTTLDFLKPFRHLIRWIYGFCLPQEDSYFAPLEVLVCSPIQGASIVLIYQKDLAGKSSTTPEFHALTAFDRVLHWKYGRYRLRNSWGLSTSTFYFYIPSSGPPGNIDTLTSTARLPTEVMDHKGSC